MYELHLVVPMSGAVLSNINTRLDARTVSILVCHSESNLLFVDVLSVFVGGVNICLWVVSLQWMDLYLGHGGYGWCQYPSQKI